MLASMRNLATSLVLTTSILAVVWHVSHRYELTDTQLFDTGSPDQIPSTSRNLIVDLERYDDPDYGFSLAVPVGWKRIVADDTDADDTADVLEMLEPGYAVGFESPRSDRTDKFADYILIEVLPGNEFGLFESAPEHRQLIEIDAQAITYDRLSIDSATDDNVAVDLVIFQRGVQALGYTIAFYAIGEPANERAMFDAFQIMLRTFTQTTEPFVVI